MVIIPATLCLITNALIYRHVRSSSTRVQTGPAASTAAPRRVSRRDVGLLGHSAIVFVIIIIGWVPGIIIYIVEYYRGVDSLVNHAFEASFRLALLANIIDLFLYNHKVRKYLTDRCLLACPRPR